jgi:alpha/beta superfamily hydrolase
MDVVEEAVAFESEGLTLEGILAYPDEGEPALALLLLSAHPHLGGNMNNNVVRHVAVAAAADGFATLRFNYRGIGRSQMRLNPGESLFNHYERMERDLRYDELLPDALAALDTLCNAIPGAPAIVLGYSLGSALAGMLAVADARVQRIAAVSPPVRRVGLAPFLQCRVPKLIVTGDRDFAFDPDRFAADFPALPEPKQHIVFPGGDHFFRKQEQDLYEAVKPFLHG